jgi:hydroxyacylglutathione hydrolase
MLSLGRMNIRLIVIMTGIMAKSRWPTIAIVGYLLSAGTGWAEVVPGSMDVRWDPGEKKCGPASVHSPIQVHRFNAQTFVLRENLCSTWEAPFLYLLIGSKRALLIDTGDIADSNHMPLKTTVFGLLPGELAAKMPLLVVHSHAHVDHREGDAQFSQVAGVTVVPSDLQHVRQYFGFSDWPQGAAQVDLGDRVVDVLPAPGHHHAHLMYYDRNTGLVFSGDMLLPGRLLVDDFRAYELSAQRVATFLKDRPVSYVLGGHVEKNRAGALLPWQSTGHIDEHVLQLPKADVLALPAALHQFNGFYTNTGNFVIENPIHNLIAAAAGVLAPLSAIGVYLGKFFRRRPCATQR